MTRRSHRSTTRLIPEACMSVCILIAVAVQFIPFDTSLEKRGAPIPIKNARAFALALDNYHSLHGHYPHDDRGAHFALYGLREWLDQSAFDLFPFAEPSTDAKWDDDHRCLLHSDFIYWNPPNQTDYESGRIIAISRRPLRDHDYLVVHAGANADIISLENGPQDSFLGGNIEYNSDGFPIALAR